MRFTILSSAVLLLTAYTSALPALSSDTLAPLYQPQDAEAVSDSYIVVLKDHVDTEKAHSHCGWVNNLHKRDAPLAELLDADAAAGIKHTYNLPGWRGYAGKFTEETVHHIRQSPEVAYVERDTMMYTSELQRGAPWGLSRISHRDALTLRDFNKYSYDAKGGQDVKVYVIDTGINIDHSDFDGRAEWGVTIPENDNDKDGNGHGSHCAGTIAGRRYGVAKKAKPVAVKVLSSNGSGSTSWVLAGVNWVIEQHQLDAENAKKANKKYKGAVANMSLGGGKSRALDTAVNQAVRSGLVFAVAAGNDNKDACNYSPAAADLAITVGASNLRDRRAYFSNFGKCVDVFAPGENILSIWNDGKDSTQTISGTSMASPHVAGLAAYFLSLEEESVEPKVIKDKILKLGSKDKLDNIPKDTPNLLIFNDAPDSFF
ncbi:serine protease 1 [Radiomyces spectabilis]|uniref:serine protease 1 n=1 Tax=Radiomyces spectabilis TaxID=64574 RepID=UPI002220CA54|nr:serine protease 1 [Radiomyces spectabilis]KAI8372859.1 serine protease 1 [Radiomyces spectabilis]